MSSKERKSAKGDLLKSGTPLLPGVRQALSTSGRPLEPAVREQMETRLGHDFSKVRIHSGEAASESARALSARAYTAGQDIVFADGQDEVKTGSGHRLLAHELAHVAQQQRGGVGTSGEAEPLARAAAERVVQGEAVPAAALGRAAPGIHCEADEEKKKTGDAPVTAASESASGLPVKLDLTVHTDPNQRPPFSLPVEPQIDWLKLRQSYGSRGVPMSDRDVDGIMKTWDRNSRLLSTFGINDRFKFLFLTKEWLLNKSVAKQVEDQQAREHPNAFDRADKEWKAAHPKGFETPMIPIFDLDWFRKKRK